MYSSIIIGSGFSGICLGIQLKAKGIHDFIILEKARDLGGTWRENTYPGAECDVPSALYSFSFEPYTHWEYKWSHQPQILEYLHHCANKYGILPHIQFEKEFTAAEWDEDQSKWTVRTKDGSVFDSKTLTPAIGQLHHPSIPKFKGADSFEGVSFHSAKWNHSYPLKNKTVGVIGTGASAVQFIPQIAKDAKQVVVFQRSANWMLPKQDRLYHEWEKSLVRRFPILLKIYRLKIWLLGGGLFFLMKNGNQWLRKFYQWQTKRYINQTIDDKELREQLVPNYPLGAKRVLFSDDYYDSLNRKNVQIITKPIKEITPQGITVADSTRYTMDAIIYSTGFIANPFLLGLDIKGKNDTSIQNAWKVQHKNYLGITVDGFPNLFMKYGPNTNLGHNSIILMIEAQSKYIVQCIDSLNRNQWKSLEVKQEVVQNYYNSIQQRLKEMIWNKIDQSWYQSEHGDIPNNWPGRTMEYVRKTKKVNFSDFNIS